LNGEIFYSLKEAQILIEQWRVEYNTLRPHSALGYRPPAPAAMQSVSVEARSTARGHGNVETAARFPHSHTPDGGCGQTPLPALH